MRTPTLIALGVFAALVVLTRRGFVIAGATPMFPGSLNTNDNVLNPVQNANYVAMTAGGPPSRLGSNGNGSITPSSGINTTIGNNPIFRLGGAYNPPRAGRALNPLLPASPGGAVTQLGPVPPGGVTPQSAVQSDSPWLPRNLFLAAPLAANPWYFKLSQIDPYIALAAGSGGFIDVARITDKPPSAMGS